MCETYCKHGGICNLEEGHEGLHTTGYCTWPDVESVSRENADPILLSNRDEKERKSLELLLEFQDMFDPHRKPS